MYDVKNMLNKYRYLKHDIKDLDLDLIYGQIELTQTRLHKLKTDHLFLEVAFYILTLSIALFEIINKSRSTVAPL